MNSYTPPRDFYMAQPLPAERRSALRTAIKQAPGWENYRHARGFTLDQMGKAELIESALALDVELSPYFPAATDEADMDEHHKPRPYAPEQVNALKARYVAAIANMSAKNKDFCSAVFKTIDDKQGERATERQYATLSRIIERAEKKADAADADTSSTATSAASFTFARTATSTASASMTTATTAPATTAAATDPAHQLATLIAQMAGQAISPETVARIVDERITAALASIPSVRIECKGADGQTRDLDGHQHPLFKRLLTAACSRDANGRHPNIWIAGPAGSGKTHAVEQVAHGMGLSFHFNGAIANAFELLGFIDAGGTYHRTAFREAFENGGVYLFDEVDGSDNSAILALNAALANGQAQFPDRMVKRHTDCVIMASANTHGLGATAEYVGRARIDGAFLDRFGIRFNWDYDTALETAISGNEAFARRVIAARERARNAGLKVLITPRASQAGAALIASGMTSDEAAELTYLANLSNDQRKIVEGK